MTATETTRTVLEAYRRLVEQPEVIEAHNVLRSVDQKIRRGTRGSGEPSILGREIDQARQQGHRDRHVSGHPPPRLLILPVGYSPEPLLLSVAYHAPEEVLFLLERSLTDDDLSVLKRVWDAYRTELEVKAFDELKCQGAVVRDTSTAVFQAVRRVVEERGDLAREQIVLDITGSKKSMIAGAFLAAGRLQIPTAYVDFSDYDQLLRRPLPGTLRPGRLQDPYQLFRLREEERLEQALDARRYPEAERLAEELAGAATDPEVEETLGVNEAGAVAERFRALGGAARACRLWSDGFYADALAAFGDCSWLPVPPAVKLLGGVWPRQRESRKDIVNALAEARVFRDPSVALGYFTDVLVWWNAERVSGQPREAFLRFYGSVESLLSFLLQAHAGTRLERLRLEEADGAEHALEELTQAAPRTAAGGSVDWGAELRDAVAAFAFQNSTTAAKLLSAKGRGVPLNDRMLPALDLPEEVDHRRVRSSQLRLRVRLREPAVPKRLTRGLHRFSDLRHKAAHWMAPVPPEEAAKLRAYLCSLLQETIPAAVERLAEDGPSDATLPVWSGRLLHAAKGQVPPECEPPLTPELRERVSTIVAGCSRRFAGAGDDA